MTDEYIRIPGGIKTTGIVTDRGIVPTLSVCVQGAVPGPCVVATGGIEPQGR